MPAITIKGGDGVGIVTRPGLQVRVGDPAINPMPRQMIRMAVAEALQGVTESLPGNVLRVEVTISIPEGRIIARKTLNERLGIIGGLSVLGTTGIVRPISTEAWTATITASMNVAEAMGRNEIVLSSGRSSERAHMTQYGLPSEAYVMMGDYVEYSLLETRKHGFGRIHLCAQWAKMLKAAMAIPHTHAKHGAIDPVKAIAFLRELGYDGSGDQGFNTTRQIFEAIASAEEAASALLFSSVCRKARTYAESITDGIPVVAHLVSYQGRIVSHDG
jgi:cobalt-precorrin-5B (C1)-methyltransferase